VYLSDFGLTKRATSDSGITATGQFVGTLDYAAPEQFEARADGRPADVYSLGGVLYECLTGEVPFPRENQAALVYAHLQSPPPEGHRAPPRPPGGHRSRWWPRPWPRTPPTAYPTAGALARPPPTPWE
jgi:serine/threonine protein kinase